MTERAHTSRLAFIVRSVFVLALLLCSTPPAASAQDGESLPTLYTNEQSVADARKQSTLDIQNVKSVFDYVLAHLPDRVHVFPTENYYYFYFYHGGVKYAGNLRFDVGQRDEGLVQFIYFKDTTDLLEDERDYNATLGPQDGVTVEKIEDLVYRVTSGGRSVIFELNDLSQVRPSENDLGPDETFLGPVADESGIRFLLTFDEKLKIFHYVLDQSAPIGDELVKPGVFKRIEIGRRTSFAFFQDPHRDRKLLVGVYEPNIMVNNYLDGPFDQLPDNFMKGDELRRALLLARPELEGEPIDRLGISPGGEVREKIAPYLEYLEVEELAPVENCGTEKDAAAVYTCLNALFPE
jgi:hypothetical protein